MQIRRSATDCCGNEATEEHFLTIDPLPPQFTQEAGSLDGTYQCDENIHPEITGRPTFVPGCKDAFLDVEIQDKSLFDEDTCKTTVTRTWTAIQDECADLR